MAASPPFCKSSERYQAFSDAAARRASVLVIDRGGRFLARNRVLLADPRAEVDELAPIAAERPNGEASDHSTGRWQVGQGTTVVMRCRLWAVDCGRG